MCKEGWLTIVIRLINCNKEAVGHKRKIPKQEEEGWEARRSREGSLRAWGWAGSHLVTAAEEDTDSAAPANRVNGLGVYKIWPKKIFRCYANDKYQIVQAVPYIWFLKADDLQQFREACKYSKSIERGLLHTFLNLEVAIISKATSHKLFCWTFFFLALKWKTCFALQQTNIINLIFPQTLT